MDKKAWYSIFFVIVIFALISLNELGYGSIAFPLLIFPVCWLMYKGFLKDMPKD